MRLADMDMPPTAHKDESMRARLTCEPTDLASFTAGLAGNFRSACDWAKLNLIVDCPPLLSKLYVDRDAWEKIVINLVANAFNSTAVGRIEIRLRMLCCTAELTVRDTGPGILESERARLFGDGRGDARTRSDRFAARSTGLVLVHELVQLYNGSIDVESEVGRGTTITVRVPLAEYRPVMGCGNEATMVNVESANRVEKCAGGGSAGAERAVLSPDAMSTATIITTRRGRVVVVDDHPDMQAYLSHVLEAAGFEVDVLANGERALAACKARPPDAVISDVVMPGLDGFELIERLRADERTAMTPVLLLSGRASEEARIAGLTAGADDYLVKPVRGRELVARVDGAIRLARMRADAARREQADLESLFAMAPDGVIVVGPTGRVLTANERARQLFAYSLGELIERHITELIRTDDATSAENHRESFPWRPQRRLVSPIQECRALRRDGSEFVGEVVFGPLEKFRNEPCTIAIVRDITERKKLESERAAQEKRFRDLSHRLVEVQEAERRRLSTELHDRTSPNLAAIGINLKLLNDVLSARGTEDVRALLEDTTALIGEASATIREISANLRPTVLDDGGLLPAVSGYAQQFMKRTGIVVHVQAKASSSSLTPAIQSSVFRIVQEALTNCAKHAGACSVTIELAIDDRDVSLVIADDGAGFDPDAQRRSGLGLITMRERAEFEGGSFTLETKSGQGTRIHALFHNGRGDAAAADV